MRRQGPAGTDPHRHGRRRGARTIAQNEETCVVFGMPKEAIKLGAVDEILPLSQMAAAIRGFDARG